MKIIGFRVKDFASIEDSGWCYLAEGITILAGKNEAGKTALLKALSFFDKDETKLEEKYLPQNDNNEPRITVEFELSPTEQKYVLQNAGWNPNSKNQLSCVKRVQLIKDVKGVYWLINMPEKCSYRDLAKDIQYEVLGNIKKHILSQIPKNSEILDSVPQLQIEPDGKRDIGKDVTNYFEELLQVLSGGGWEQPQQAVKKKIDSLFPEDYVFPTVGKLVNQLVKKVPSFIMFSSFDDMLPFEIPLSEAISNRTVSDLATVAELDLKRLVDTKEPQRRINILNDVSAQITGNFGRSWGQDAIDIELRPYADRLHIGFRDKGKTNLFSLEQRSKGLQWFVSFYLRMQANKAKMSKVILIDEPGLFLHAKAQEDVLGVLRDMASNNQIVFSTHSPYLIEANELSRVRLVTKGESGTKVENKIYKTSDSETLTPILTAIGLELAKSVSFPHEKNLVVEGITDYYYLRAGVNILQEKKMEVVSIIPGKGATKLHPLISLLIGWGCNFGVLLDNDKAGRSVRKELVREFCLDENAVLVLTEDDDQTIEGLLSDNDFRKYILGDEGRKIDITDRAKALKKEKMDRVLKSKSYYEATLKGEVELDKESLNNYEKLFARIKGLFS